MPVVDSDRSNTLLEDTLDACVHGRSCTFQDVEDHLHDLKERDETNLMRCSPMLMKNLTTLIKQSLKDQEYHNVCTILACIQYIATECSETKGLVVLIENGLLELIVFMYEEVTRPICDQDTPQSEVNLCLIQLLETVNDVADFDSSTKESVALLLVEKLMVFIVNIEQNFSVKMEALRTLNLLLEGCPSKYLKALQLDGTIKKILHLIAAHLPKTGDFEMQVACTETLIRVIKKSDRDDFGSKCFKNDDVLKCFLKIRDACFEVDCRTFLNTLNEKQGRERRVFSIPCEEAFLGTYKVKCPEGDQLKELWVDFNQMSRTMTIYVAEEGTANEESSMWETVTISDDIVRKCDIKRVGDLQHVEIALSVPASCILPFSNSDAKCVRIIFAPHHDLQCPLTFCFQADKICTEIHKKSSECTIKVLFKRMGDGGGIATENFYSGVRSASKNYPGVEKLKSLSVPLKRTKVSTPLIPMDSPHGKEHNPQGKATSSTRKKSIDMNQPRTPQHHPAPKRVKTPLNVTVSDKASSGSDADKVWTQKRTTKKDLNSTTLDTNGHPTRDLLDDDSGAGSDTDEAQRQKGTANEDLTSITLSAQDPPILQRLDNGPGAGSDTDKRTTNTKQELTSTTLDANDRPTRHRLDDGAGAAGDTEKVHTQIGITDLTEDHYTSTALEADDHHTLQRSKDAAMKQRHIGDADKEEMTRADRQEASPPSMPDQELNENNDSPSSSNGATTKPTKPTSNKGVQKSSVSTEELTSSKRDQMVRKTNKAQELKTPQAVPESQVSQVVISETQDVTSDVVEQQSSNQSTSQSQADEKPSSRTRNNRLRRSNTAAGSRKRWSPRLEALVHLNALSVAKKRRSQGGKFRLYSEENSHLDDPDQENFVPSTYPSQDSMADFLPDSNPTDSNIDKRRKQGSPGLSDIPEKLAESTSSEWEEKEKAKQRPKRMRKARGKAVSSSATRTRPADKSTARSSSNRSRRSKKFKEVGKEDDTSSESSTLHQTREFLSNSLPVLSPSSVYADPYLFTDIKDSVEEKPASARKVPKQKQKNRPAKSNRNLPDKATFLSKKSFMSFPSKSLTKTKSAEPVVHVQNDGKGDSRGAATGKRGSKKNGHDRENVKRDTTLGSPSEGDDDDAGRRMGEEEENEESDKSINNNNHSKSTKRVDGERRFPLGVMEEQIVTMQAVGDGRNTHAADKSSKRKLVKQEINKKALVDDRERRFPLGVMEKQIAVMQAGGDGRNTHAADKSRKRKLDKQEIHKKALVDVSGGLTSREVEAESEVEVMRDAPHLTFDDDYRDDELRNVLSSFTQFMEQTNKQTVKRKQVSCKTTPRRVIKVQARESRRKVRGSNLGKIFMEEEEDLECTPEVDESVIGIEKAELNDAEKDESNGEEIDYIREELMALSQELQVAKKKKKSDTRERDKRVDFSESVTPKGGRCTPKKDDGSGYGSEIQDDEVEELSDLNLETEECDSRLAPSVQSFNKLCQSIIYQSGGDGIANTRSRRHLAKVDYKDKDTSYSDEDFEPIPFAKTVLVSLDIQSEDDEGRLSVQSRRRSSAMSDKQDERSWLVEKSTVEVSTYSKIKRREWIKQRPNEDVFKISKKISDKTREKRMTSPVQVPTEPIERPKKKKKHSLEENEDMEDGNLYYNQDLGDHVLRQPELLLQKPIERPKKKKKHSLEEDEDMEDGNLYYNQDLEDHVLRQPELLIQKISATGIQSEDAFTPDVPHHTAKSSSFSKKGPRSRGSSRDCKELGSSPLLSPPTVAASTVTGVSSTSSLPDVVLTPMQGNITDDDEDEDVALFSGPKKMGHITQSTLRRKYEHLVKEITHEEEEEDEDDDDDAGSESHSDEFVGANVSLNPPPVRRAINPRRLFERELQKREQLVLGNQAITGYLYDDEDEDEDDEYTEGISLDPSSSTASSSSYWMNNPMNNLPIPDMMTIVGEKIKKQMAEKKIQTKMLSEAALRTTQSHLSKLWVGQNKRRNKALQEFRESLFKEIVGLDMDIDKMVKATEQLQATSRKMKTFNDSKYSKVIRSLHENYIQELKELDRYIGHTLRESIPAIWDQEISSLKKRILGDIRVQELDQMKKAFSSYLNM